jgi:hypothetical protein
MPAALQGMGKRYVSLAFPTPGTVLSLQLTVIPARTRESWTSISLPEARYLARSRR